MAKLMVDPEICMGCGQCVAMFEDNFEFDDETGTSTVKSSDNAGPEMVDLCPVGAIKLLEEEEVSNENE